MASIITEFAEASGIRGTTVSSSTWGKNRPNRNKSSEHSHKIHAFGDTTFLVDLVSGGI